MTYGLKLYNTNGDSKIITPDDATIISGGELTLPNSLEVDNTYGEDISLGATYNEEDISVIVIPRRPVFNVTYNRFIDAGTLYYNTFYLDSTKTYYTRNTSTGVMTSFSAGNKTVNQKDTWNPICSVFPVAFWDKMGATTFSNIRLFGATAYLTRSPVNDINLSLSGTPTASITVIAGDNPVVTGTAANINDNDINTKYGAYNGSGDYDYTYSATITCTVTFSEEKIVNIVELVFEIWGEYYVAGNYDLSLYYDGGWHSVMTSSWTSAGEVAGTYTHSTNGSWRRCTAIKVVGAIFGSNARRSGFYCKELRAWGTNSTDDSENKIVYSIGSEGVSKVDYLICKKGVV